MSENNKVKLIIAIVTTICITLITGCAMWVVIFTEYLPVRCFAALIATIGMITMLEKEY